MPKDSVDKINASEIVYECVFCEVYGIIAAQERLADYVCSLCDQCISVLKKSLSLAQPAAAAAAAAAGVEDKVSRRAQRRKVARTLSAEHSCVGVLLEPLYTALPLLAGSARDDLALCLSYVLPSLISLFLRWIL